MTIPTTAFANAVLANVQAKQPAEASLYQKMFGIWSGAPNAASAVPIANSSYCNSIVLSGFNPNTQNCAARFDTSAGALGSEWILAGRVDQKIGDKDVVFYRYKLDHGLQPTTISLINPNFNALSNQPEYDNQLTETHIFGPSMTNEFKGSASHYVAIFSQSEPLASNTFPVGIVTSGAVPFTSFGAQYDFPQGRDITQYQFIDDFALIRGKHNMKFGENFRRYDVSDQNFFFNYPGVYFGYVTAGLQNFANGLAYQYRKTLNAASDVPIAMWGMGVYAQDEWNVRSNLKLTLTLRVEHNSNPVCQFNCFADFNGPWQGLPSVTSAAPGNVPYSSDIATGLHQAYPSTDGLDYAPRFGFNWSPGKSNKWVVGGGFGLFYDNPAAGLVDDLLANPPSSVAIRVRPSAGVLPFDPGPNGGAAIWQASANSFSLSQTYSQISASLKVLGAVFAAPAFTSLQGNIASPRWQEWNLQVQRQLSNSMALTVNYVGNHGIHLPYTNSWANAFDLYGIYPGVKGIPASAPVPNYGQVSLVQFGAISDYNGMTVTLTKRFSRWFSTHLNYTWSHNLDEASNGGVFTYGDSQTLSQINPTSLRANNYGNSDYDIRHNFNADWVVTPTPQMSNPFLRQLLNGWSWSGKWYWRSGLPFSIEDGNWNGGLGNGGGVILATPIGGGAAQTSCGSGNIQNLDGTGTPCLNPNVFLNSGAASFNNFTAWSPQTRNQFRGPHYFNVDMNLHRNFKLPFREGMNLGIGVQAFNVFNHPNFSLPDNGLGDSTFGLIGGTVNAPVSPYGSFLGFDSSVRVVQLTARITF
ncbi:MAG: hypothetical protein ABSH28_00055 [Acidobacteriota bacterium]